MSTLNTQLRNKLERAIVDARDIAEAGAKEALESLAVHHHEPYKHMAPEVRKLRNHLRARARQIGDKQDKSGRLDMRHIIHECAYEYWHRMLFARFLAENDLLIDPDMGVAITLPSARNWPAMSARTSGSTRVAARRTCYPRYSGPTIHF